MKSEHHESLLWSNFSFRLGPQAGGVMVLNITLFMFTGKQLVNRYTCLSVVLIINIYIYIYIYIYIHCKRSIKLTGLLYMLTLHL